MKFDVLKSVLVIFNTGNSECFSCPNIRNNKYLYKKYKKLIYPLMYNLEELTLCKLSLSHFWRS